MSFSVKLQPKRRGSGSERICLVQAKDATGHRAWYFLRISPLKGPQFDKIVASKETFDLLDYGEIIKSGYGEDVPQAALDSMKAEYGWEA